MEYGLYRARVEGRQTGGDVGQWGGFWAHFGVSQQDLLTRLDTGVKKIGPRMTPQDRKDDSQCRKPTFPPMPHPNKLRSGLNLSPLEGVCQVSHSQARGVLTWAWA